MTTVGVGQTLTISAANQISSGLLTMDNNSTLAMTQAFTLPNNIAVSGSATFNVTAFFDTFTGTIANASGTSKDSITVTGGGGLSLQSSGNTYSGGTTVVSSTLSIFNGNVLGSGALTLESGSDLQVGSSTTIANNILLSGTGNLLFAFASSPVTFSGAISDAPGSAGGSIKFSGSGTIDLTGQSSYTGSSEIIDNTTLIAGAAGALADQSAFTVDSGSVLDIGGFDESIDGIAGSGVVTNNGTSAGNLVVEDDVDSTTGITFQDGKSALALTFVGVGDETLTGANTYSGGTTIATGALTIGAADNIGTGAVTFAGDATLNMTAAFTLGNAIDISGTATLNVTKFFDTLTGTIADASGTSGDSLVVTGGGGLSLQLADNTFSGGMTIIKTTVSVFAGNALGTGAITLEDGSDIQVGSSTTISNEILLSGSGNLLYAYASSPVTFSGSIEDAAGTSGGAFLYSGSGVIDLTGQSSYTATSEIIDNTTLVTAANFALSKHSALTVDSGSVLDLDGFYQQTDGIAGSGVVTNNGAQLAVLFVSDNVDSTTGITFQDGTAALELSFSGADDQTLTGMNTYTGGTNVEIGSLSIAADDNIGSGALELALGATLNLTAGFTLGNDIQLDSSNTINTTAGGDRLTGVISDLSGDTGSLVITGAGIAIDGDDTYSGGTTIDDSSLAISATGAGTGAIVLIGSTLELADNSTTANAIELSGTGNDIYESSDVQATLTGAISDAPGSSGSLLVDGSGVLNLEGASTYTGSTEIINNTTLVAAAANVLAASSVYTIDNGSVLDINAADETIGGLAGGGVLTNNGASFEQPSIDDTVDSTFSGTIQDGAAVLGVAFIGTADATLTGESTYSGGTLLENGSLSINNNSEIGSGALTVSDAQINLTDGFTFTNAINMFDVATFSQVAGNTNTLSGAISDGGDGDPGGLSLAGGGDMVLSGNDTYVGGTLIGNGSKLELASANAGGSGIVAFDGDGTLQVDVGDGQNIQALVDFDGTDFLILEGVNANSAFVNSNNQLVLSENGTQQYEIQLFGNYANEYFSTFAVSHGTQVLGTGIEIVPKPATVAGYQAQQAIYNDVGGGIAIADTAANIKAGLAFLQTNSSHITSITATDTTVSVTAAMFGADKAVLDKIVGGFLVSDSAPNVVSVFSTLGGDVHASIAITSGSATLSSGNTFAGPGFSISGASTLTLGENFNYSGSFSEAAVSTVSVSSGDTFSLKGSSTLSGTVTGAGTLALSGGTATISAGAKLTTNNLSIVGANVTLNEALAYSGGFTFGVGSKLALTAGALTLKGATSFSGGAFSGVARVLTQGATTVNGAVTFGGSAGVTNSATLTETGNGAITLADSSGSAINFTNASTGVIDFVNNNGIALGNAAATTITNSGLIEKTAGVGVSAISASLSGAGGIAAQTGALELLGASNTLSGALTGTGKIYFEGGGTTTLNSGVTASVAGLLIAGTNTTVRLLGNLSYGGSFTQVGGTSLKMTSGLTLSLTGASSLGGTIFGASTLAMTGGSATILATAAISTTSWITSGTAITIAGGQSYSGAFSASGETITLNAVWSFAGSATFTNVKLTGTNQIRLGKASTIASGLTLGGATSLTNFLSVTQSGGNVVMGDSANGATKLINTGASTVWNITDNSSILLGNSKAATINNTGTIEKSGGSGVSTIAAAIVNGGNGKLEALSGTLDLSGAITAKGYDVVSGASTLEFDGSVVNTQTVEFQGANSVLDLTNWGTFSGVISTFDSGGASGDTIDVASPWTWVGFNQSTDMMTFADGATQHAVKLTGSYIAADFHHSVVNDVTQVTYG